MGIFHIHRRITQSLIKNFLGSKILSSLRYLPVALKMPVETRSKKVKRTPQDKAGDESTKENRIADKPGDDPTQENSIAEKLGDEPTQQNWVETTDPDESPPYRPSASDSPKEDKTNVNYDDETSPIKAPQSPIAKYLGSIDHNLDVNTIKQEDAEKFNETTISVFSFGTKLINNISKNEYRFICKIGYGGFSIAWLVIDMKSKEFKVAKVFKYGYGIKQLEIDTLTRIAKFNDPYILRYYENLPVKSGERLGNVAIYEPLGKDLQMLMKEAAKHGGLSVPVIKKVAKHILTALSTIHDLSIVHTDIKLNNISTCVSQLSLRHQLEKIINCENPKESLSSLRMACQKSIIFDENKTRKLLKDELAEVKIMEHEDANGLIFKLIDFGNIVKSGVISSTGTPGFRPPEYFFRAPLLASHDIWSLGVTIVVLLTNKRFLDIGKDKNTDELTRIKNMFGKFSRSEFKDFKKYNLFEEGFTTNEYEPKEAEERIRKMLFDKFNGLRILDDDKNGLIDFLLQMLNTIPNERKSAEELLSHPWLNDVKNAAKFVIENVARSDINSRKFVVLDELLNVFSDASKTQGREETSVNETGTPDDCVAASSKLKNIDETTEKSKATKRPHEPFICKENDKWILYYRYWKIRFRSEKYNDYFFCPQRGCKKRFIINKDKKFQPKIGFVDVVQHKCNSVVSKSLAPKKLWDEVEMKRQLLLMKVKETEEDSNKTISEFGSGNSYSTLDATCAPKVQYIAVDGIGEKIEVDWNDISSGTLEVCSYEESDNKENENKIISDFGSSESYSTYNSSSSVPYIQYVDADGIGEKIEVDWNEISSGTLEAINYLEPL